MPTVRSRYRAAGPILVRASTDSRVLDRHPLPDLGTVRDGLAWLATQWSQPRVREALTVASPDLGLRITQMLHADPAHAEPDAVRRAVMATVSYLMRWQRRATPFGLFAGVSTATVGPTVAKIGDGHRAIARVDAEWLTLVVDQLEGHRGLRRTLMVVADRAGMVRDGRFLVAGRPTPGERTPAPLRENSVRFTPVVRLALTGAARPVRFDQLAARIAATLPHIDDLRIEAMLHGLIDGGFLITSLRPPTTTVDGLAHVIEAIRAANGERLADIAPVLDQLREIQEQIRRHNTVADPQQAARIRTRLATSMTGMAPGTTHTLAIDMRLDADIRVSERVLDEAAHAATVLLRLTTQPFGAMAWLDYHARFRTRYGPGTLVPVWDLVADSGLGYPPGFLGAPRARPAWRMLTERDAYLLALMQEAILAGAEEIDLTDADIEALTVGDHHTIVVPPRIEMGVTVHAASAEAMDHGDFVLRITGAPRAHTSMAGRFAHLLDPADGEQLARTYTAAADQQPNGAIVVQLSFPPRRVHNDNVVRTGRLLPDVVSLSEYPDGDVIGIDDFAVTADADQLYLVRRSTGQRVIPQIPHALDTTVQTPPLARFLAEVADARSAVFGPLDLGAAGRILPYTPRIRYKRTILSPARWLLSTSDIPAGTAWADALVAWQQRWRVPGRVVACHGELRLPLDLDQPIDRALLQRRLTKAERLELREDGPANGHGWIGRPAELLITMLAHAPAPRPLPVIGPPGNTLRPGASTVVHAQLTGNPARFDHVLTEHVTPLADSLTDLGVRRWWVRRHRDTIRLEADQYLSVFLQLDDSSLYGAVAERLAQFAAGLHERGLPAELVFAAYHQHPARYGYGPALEAAEHVFAADTAVAVHQLRVAHRGGTPAQALAAASMAILAAGFAPDPMTGYRNLLTCLKQDTEPADRTLRDHVRVLVDPTGDFRAVRGLPGGDAVAATWRARNVALGVYRASLLSQRDPTGVLRTLLHEHHVRAVGVDAQFERQTGHLARAAAMRCLALLGAP